MTMAKQSMRKFKRLLKQGTSERMTKADWREVAHVLGSDAGPGVRKKAGNPTKRSIRKRVSRSLTKYVKGFTGSITRNPDGTVVIVGTGPKPKGARAAVNPSFKRIKRKITDAVGRTRRNKKRKR